MRKFCFLLCVLTFVSASARADGLAWVLRPPAAGVKEGETAQIELVAINANATSQALDAPAILSGDIGEAGNKTIIELKLVGEAPKFVPVGGFVAVPYNMVVPPGVGEKVVRIRTPLEATAVLRVLPAKPVAPTTTMTTSTPIEPTTKVIVAPSPLSLDPTSRLPTTSQSGLTEFVRNKLSPHEPMYFISGNDTPSAKFQVSFKYQLFDDQSTLVATRQWLTGFYLGYTQTSFWDIGAKSAPFFDSTYNPEIFWAVHDLRLSKFPSAARFDFQTGFQHQSNGKAGDDSRTMNSLYVQPIFTLGDRDALFLTVAPRAKVYVGSLSDNADITTYYGYFDLKFVIGQGDGLQAAIIGRIGDAWDKGSVQLDLSYPLRKVLYGNLDLYLHAQVFNGYGESLLRYNEAGTTFRVGLSVVR